MREYRRILVTGGAGFVGSSLSLRFAETFPQAEVVALDNLRRRGSELALGRLADGGVRFLHGDVRNSEDIDQVGDFDLFIDCAAEPSVQAGYDSSPSYLVNANLTGTLNSLEAARRCGADVVFLSSSRVYPIAPLRALPLARDNERLAIDADQRGEGWSSEGITAGFPLSGPRSMYGATKLAAELFIDEYRSLYGLRAIVNRCGVLTGPWQMGKVDQGFVVLWAARHLYGGALSYRGFGGEGLQVRDMLHVEDLFELVQCQLAMIDEAGAAVCNVGGGPGISVSLAELTGHCRRRSGRDLQIAGDPETHPSDIPYYVTDLADVETRFAWRPKHGVDAILDDVFAWLEAERATLEPILT